jgi:hypothetical protein
VIEEGAIFRLSVSSAKLPGMNGVTKITTKQL